MPSRPRARTVRRSHEFGEQASLIEPDVRRFDELMAAIEWALASDPYQFPLVPGTAFRVVKAEEFPGMLRLRIAFTISDDDETVSLLAISKAVDLES